MMTFLLIAFFGTIVAIFLVGASVLAVTIKEASHQFHQAQYEKKLLARKAAAKLVLYKPERKRRQRGLTELLEVVVVAILMLIVLVLSYVTG